MHAGCEIGEQRADLCCCPFKSSIGGAAGWSEPASNVSTRTERGKKVTSKSCNIESDHSRVTQPKPTRKRTEGDHGVPHIEPPALLLWRNSWLRFSVLVCCDLRAAEQSLRASVSDIERVACTLQSVALVEPAAPVVPELADGLPEL